jgi:CheY-like chemotaxis protein
MKSIHILLAEDNEGDILLTTEALESGDFILNKISVVKDGKEAINFLEKSGKYVNTELPDLVLLDINLPKKNGQEVLKFIKESEALKHIPVIMFTTSSSRKDIMDCYQNFANCYITKPIEADEFTDVVLQIKDFWVSAAHLPS